jgi:hypothetical protein
VHFAWPHGQVRLLTFEGLHPGLFVNGNGPHPFA